LTVGSLFVCAVRGPRHVELSCSLDSTESGWCGPISDGAHPAWRGYSVNASCVELCWCVCCGDCSSIGGRRVLLSPRGGRYGLDPLLLPANQWPRCLRCSWLFAALSCGASHAADRCLRPSTLHRMLSVTAGHSGLHLSVCVTWAHPPPQNKPGVSAARFWSVVSLRESNPLGSLPLPSTTLMYCSECLGRWRDDERSRTR
jgi:hypothetical protein